ncbi:MAG TPA: FapA family protein [bacterium]|nr:FapA family protein [bacterium]
MTSRDVDGYPNINTADDGLVLTVYPPEGSGKKVGFEEVRAEIEKLGFKGVKWEDVKHVVEAAKGRAAVIVAPKARSGDSPIFVEISDDQMTAKVTVLPPEQGGHPASLDRVRAALAANGVVHGILEGQLQALAGPLAALGETGKVHEPVESLIAQGQPVVHGTDAYLEKYWEKKDDDAPVKNAAGVENKNAQVNYRDLNTIENVAKDAVLCKLVPATPGSMGVTVTGKELAPNPGLPMVLKPGLGAKVDPNDPTQFIATETGQVVLKGELISVLALYEVNGDLTLKIGNIDFLGTVIIHGSVTGEYKVKAGQDVIIDGVLDGGEVAAGGKVQIKGGIIGQKTRVTADGNVETKYVRNAYVESGGAVTVVDGIMHSTVIASDKVFLSGRGTLVGGTTVAGWEVVAKEIGAKSGVPTEIEVGEDPRLRDEMRRIEKESKSLLEQLDKTKKGVQFLKDMSAKLGGKLPDDKKEMLNKLTRAQFKFLADLKLIQTRKTEIEQKETQEKGKRRAKVSCSGLFYPGTKITVSRVSRAITMEEKYTSFVEDNGQIKALPFG